MNEGHRRSISSAAYVAEKLLREVAAAVASSSELSPSRRAEVEAKLAEFRNSFRAFEQAFSGPREVVPLRRAAQGALTYLWTVLEDLRPKRMKAYGELERGEAEEVEKHVERLLAQLRELENLMR